MYWDFMCTPRREIYTQQKSSSDSVYSLPWSHASFSENAATFAWLCLLLWMPRGEINRLGRPESPQHSQRASLRLGLSIMKDEVILVPCTLEPALLLTSLPWAPSKGSLLRPLNISCHYPLSTTTHSWRLSQNIQLHKEISLKK